MKLSHMIAGATVIAASALSEAKDTTDIHGSINNIPPVTAEFTPQMQAEYIARYDMAVLLGAIGLIGVLGGSIYSLSVSTDTGAKS